MLDGSPMYLMENGQPTGGAAITYRPLTGRLARLAAEAYPRIANRSTPDTDAYYDNLFDAGLSDNTAITIIQEPGRSRLAPVHVALARMALGR